MINVHAQSLLSLALFAALTTLGCRSDARRLERASEELATVSRDQCINSWLSDTRRKHLVKAVADGRVPSEVVDTYIEALRALVDKHSGSRMSVDSFCRLQRNLWRRHFNGRP